MYYWFMMKHKFYLQLALIALFAMCIATVSYAQLLFPKVIVNTDPLPEEAQKKLVGLDSLLTIYLQNQEWAGDRYNYDFPIQMNIYFTEYIADPREDHYKAKLIATNKSDARFEDVRWEFGLRTPFAFQPSVYQPFKSVVEFYVWMLIGTEYDKLEKLGGGIYYEKARQIYLESSASIFVFGWDKRIDMLRAQVDDRNKIARELSFFYHTGIYYDEKKDYSKSKDYLYYALVKLDKVPIDVQEKFLDTEHRQFAEALLRSGYTKGITALIRMDPKHRSVYETIAPKAGGE
jgi:hypothetical protein